MKLPFVLEARVEVSSCYTQGMSGDIKRDNEMARLLRKSNTTGSDLLGTALILSAPRGTAGGWTAARGCNKACS